MINQTNKLNNNRRVATICRLTPIHMGHKKYLVKLANEFDKLIVMIGSCYESGSFKHCITATEREKMLRAVFKRENIPDEKFEIIPIPDLRNFDKWFDMVMEICNMYQITHFCTGNKEDILDVLEERGEKLPFEFINPEENTDFPYHATDIRNLILEGKYEELEKLIPDETKPILFRNTFKEILAASKERGIKFVPGRQTVDMVFLVRNTDDGNIYVLLGKSNAKDPDTEWKYGLPGGEINKYETASNAVIRNLFEETGIKVKMLDNSLEPAIIRIENVTQNNLEQMSMIGLYSNNSKNGEKTVDGSSQGFGIFIEDSVETYRKIIKSDEDLATFNFYKITEIFLNDLSFQQMEMISKAITMFEAYPKLVKPLGKNDEI